MLANFLAIAVALGSGFLLLAAFVFPSLHRKDDFLWGGVGLFYGLVLWICHGQMTGAVLLGQTAGVALLGWFAWETLRLRQAIANPEKIPNLDQFSLLNTLQAQLFKKKPTASDSPMDLGTTDLGDDPDATEAIATPEEPETPVDSANATAEEPETATSPAIAPEPSEDTVATASAPPSEPVTPPENGESPATETTPVTPEPQTSEGVTPVETVLQDNGVSAPEAIAPGKEDTEKKNFSFKNVISNLNPFGEKNPNPSEAIANGEEDDWLAPPEDWEEALGENPDLPEATDTIDAIAEAEPTPDVLEEVTLEEVDPEGETLETIEAIAEETPETLEKQEDLEATAISEADPVPENPAPLADDSNWDLDEGDWEDTPGENPEAEEKF